MKPRTEQESEQELFKIYVVLERASPSLSVKISWDRDGDSDDGYVFLLAVNSSLKFKAGSNTGNFKPRNLSPATKGAYI